MQLGDNELLSKLIKKRDFDVESRLKLRDYLKDEMREEVERELKELTESLIEGKGNYAYKNAVECSLVLRKIVDDTT